MFKEVRLTSVNDIRNFANLPDDLLKIKLEFDSQLKENFHSKKRLVVVCGPCSVDDEKAIIEYLHKLKELADSHPNLLVVARVYTAKPHSNGQGYKGLSFEYSGTNVLEGIIKCRKIMIECIKLGLPVADELLYPSMYPYFSDLVSYWFVGARSSEDNLHRDFASGLETCCGVKNSTDGNIRRAVDSLYAVSHKSSFILDQVHVTTDGCKTSHIVLRGGADQSGFVSNIDQKNVSFAKQLLEEQGLSTFIMADLSHANSKKIALNQLENAKLVANNPLINGVMIESYLYDGKSDCAYGVSKTDECIGIENTQKVFDILEQRFAK